MTIRPLHIALALLFALVVNAAMITLLAKGALVAPVQAALPKPVPLIPIALPPTPPPPETDPEEEPLDRTESAAIPQQTELRAPTLPSAFQDPGVGPPQLDIGSITNLGPPKKVKKASKPKPTIREADQVDEPPKPRVRAMPRYPPSAEERGIEGEVVLRILINARGQVDRARVVSARPPGVFEASALASIKGWRFVPARDKGKAIAVWATKRMRFKLK